MAKRVPDHFVYVAEQKTGVLLNDFLRGGTIPER